MPVTSLIPRPFPAGAGRRLGRMKPLRAATPPPAHLVSALVLAGVSRETALAMDTHKAEEVLELVERSLRPQRRGRSTGSLHTAPGW